ncbi:hypothetical protein BDB00DRAFT_822371 [Zychaea mexicana]|uniref:uncharacterized protein n=1 Tax=Zychaea mexicana TaxID=64656 RepID=UPI0022FDE9B9|nr:uncharacterized protein BDB00DRAFT_822371 [Zychaea mexicana]KAI9493539.1 hypothetical protein BDB00DRAFT_822371 [Zychaea mexicana]
MAQGISNDNDDKLAQLLSLGFDIDICRAALARNDSVQAATDWILGGNEAAASSARGPVLSLQPESLPAALQQQQQHEQEQQPLSAPSVTRRQERQLQQSATSRQADDGAAEAARMREQSLKMSKEAKQQKKRDKEARERALAHIKEDRERQKLLKGTHATAATGNESSTGAGAANTEQHRLGQQKAATEYEKTQQEIKKQRRLDREAKNRTLREIQEDRENMRRRHINANKPSTVAGTTTRASSLEAPTKKPAVQSNRDFALVQFKLRDGSTVRQQFQASAQLFELYAFAREKENSAGKAPLGNGRLRLISAFPKREFTEDEGLMTVQDAGFVPNVSLNVVLLHLAEQDPNNNPPGSRDQDNDAEMQDAQSGGGSGEGQESYDAATVGDYGHGHHHADQVADVDTMDHNLAEGGNSDNSDDGDEEMPNAFNNQPAINPHRPPTHNLPFTRRGRLTNPNWNWGTQGHRLADDDAAAVSDADEHQQIEGGQQSNEPVRRQNMLLAIERRGAAAAAAASQQQQHARGKARNIRSLRDTCAVSVAVLLIQPTLEAQTRLKNLLYASPKVAELLLAQLIESRKLERSSMKRLADHCYLQNVCLDSYVYATDSLLQELSLSHSSTTVAKLSLKGCDVITDSGIRYIEGLKNLEYLDASNCKVTDKGIRSLTGLSQLRYLNLSKTKITDAGLQPLVANAHFKDNLEFLLLDGCHGIKSSDTLMMINDAFYGLVSLGLASTRIGRQTVVTRPQLASLQSLDVSNTSLTDEDAIQTICSYKELRELKLSGCSQISLRGLGCFARDLHNLEVIQFPSREQELDGVLARYAALPLRHLDLTSFQVTDEGADSIARMKKLQYLSLDGTKITDEGVSKFSGLTDLRKLFLDRTLVSDEGVSQLIGLTKLDTLSLSRTQVSNTLLILLGDFEKTGFTRCLRTLNLAQCQNVSDRGVRGLGGMVNLKNINLDHTHVSKQCLRHLQNLEHLKLVRLLGIERDEDEEEAQLV